MSNVDRSQDQRRDHDQRGDERRQVAIEIADRLRRRGVHLTGRETDEELVGVLEAVERFETTVERHGGDLMVDEPVDGRFPLEPDDRRFVLPRRHEQETVAAFVDRIARATERAATGEHRGGD